MGQERKTPPLPYQDQLLSFKEMLWSFAVEISEQNQFHNIETPIPRLGLRDPRMEHSQPLGHFPLGKPCFFSGCNELL
jgi:hypothetical protein